MTAHILYCALVSAFIQKVIITPLDEVRGKYSSNDSVQNLNKGKGSVSNDGEAVSEEAPFLPTDSSIDTPDIDLGYYVGNTLDDRKQVVDDKIQNNNARSQTRTESLPSCFVAYQANIGKNSEFMRLLEDNNFSIKESSGESGSTLVFCGDPGMLPEIQMSGVIIESDHVYGTSGVMLDPPEYIFEQQNMKSRLLTNWILDRPFARILGFRFLYKFFFGYYKNRYTGKDVDVYMLDTTVDTSLEMFDGRVKNWYKPDYVCNRHGTVAASLIAGKGASFAPDAQVTVLNVVDCNGHVPLHKLLHALSHVKENNRNSDTVLLYIGVSGPYSEILTRTVDELSSKNIIIVTAAGNESDLACTHSPGAAKSVINVGSINKFRVISEFSNFGACIRVFALGENLSLPMSGGGSALFSGTSYSAAIATSAIASYLTINRAATFKMVWNFLNRITELQKSIKILLPPTESAVKGDETLKKDANGYGRLDMYDFGTAVNLLISFIPSTLLILLLIYLVKNIFVKNYDIR